MLTRVLLTVMGLLVSFEMLLQGKRTVASLVRARVGLGPGRHMGQDDMITQQVSFGESFVAVLALRHQSREGRVVVDTRLTS